MDSITTRSAEAVKTFVIQRIQGLIEARIMSKDTYDINRGGMSSVAVIDNEIRLLTMLRNDLRSNIAIVAPEEVV